MPKYEPYSGWHIPPKPVSDPAMTCRAVTTLSIDQHAPLDEDLRLSTIQGSLRHAEFNGWENPTDKMHRLEQALRNIRDSGQDAPLLRQMAESALAL